MACRAISIICPHCNGPHKAEEHRKVASCCKGNDNTDPPILPTPQSITECPHKAHCINCGGSHAANWHKCKFWDHRFDQQWINAKYAEVLVSTRPRNQRSHGWHFGGPLRPPSTNSLILELKILHYRISAKQRKVPACKAIQYNGQPCHEMNDFWNALHNTYNLASG